MNLYSKNHPIVALYLRVSTSQQDHEMQRNDLLREVEKQGYSLFNEYTDTITGSTSVSQRRYASDVIEDARNGKFKILLVWRIDRIARDEEYGLNYLRQIEETGCKVHFITQPSINSPEHYTPEGASMVKTMRNMLLMGARMEHENIKARTRAAKIRWIKDNKWPAGGGHIPDGYKLTKDYGLEIEELRAPIIKRIFSLYIDEGLTVRKIRDLLNKEGIPSFQGRKWGKDTIQDKLNNPVYTGKLPQQGKKLQLTHVFTCPPIISDERFAEVQQRKQERIDRSKRNPTREFPFRPFVWCAICGKDLHSMVSGRSTQSGETYHYGFRKPSKNQAKYKKRCPEGCGRISEIKLVDALYKRFSTFFRTPSKRFITASVEEVRELLESDSGSEDSFKRQEQELASLKKEVLSIRQQEERIIDLYESGLITKKNLEIRKAKIPARLKIVEEKIRFIEQNRVGEEERSKQLQKIAAWVDLAIHQSKVKHLGSAYASETPAGYEARRDMVVKLLKTIKRIEVNFKEREITIFTKAPKYLDGKATFEPDPVVKLGRPPRNDSGGSGSGNSGSVNSSILVASGNSSRHDWVIIIPF